MNQKLSDWANVGQIVSSIAVVVTLGFLVAQIAQNTAAVQASTRQAMLADARGLLTTNLEHPELNRFNTQKLAELSDDDRTRISAWLTMFVRTEESEWLQYQEGVIDERTWLTYAAPLTPNLSTEVSRSWWETRSARGEFDPDFTAYVNEQLAKVPARIRSVSESTGIGQ
jgi:hypothetical protein